MLNGAKSLLETIKSDFGQYGYTPDNHVSLALRDVVYGYTSPVDFRKAMISGPTLALKNGTFDGLKRSLLRTFLGHMIQGRRTIYNLDPLGYGVEIPVFPYNLNLTR